jgi:hypothetical protein
MRTHLLVVLAMVLAFVWLVGCTTTSPEPPKTDKPGEHSHDGHDHAHGHSHADLGPNGGHLLELGDEKFHAEWVHDDEAGKLSVFILDGAAKELVPIAAEKITIEKKVGDRSDTYDLHAVDRQGETPKSAKFEIVDKALIEALKLAGDGVEASIKIDVNGEPFTAKFTKHEHHGHKH